MFHKCKAAGLRSAGTAMILASARRTRRRPTSATYAMLRNFAYVCRKLHVRRPYLRNIRPGRSISFRLPASIAIFQKNTQTAGHIAYAVSMKSVLYPPIPRLESGFVLVARSRSGAERHILPARICRPLAAMAIWFRRRPLASLTYTATLFGLRKIPFLQPQ